MPRRAVHRSPRSQAAFDAATRERRSQTQRELRARRRQDALADTLQPQAPVAAGPSVVVGPSIAASVAQQQQHRPTELAEDAPETAILRRSPRKIAPKPPSYAAPLHRPVDESDWNTLVRGIAATGIRANQQAVPLPPVIDESKTAQEPDPLPPVINEFESPVIDEFESDQELGPLSPVIDEFETNQDLNPSDLDDRSLTACAEEDEEEEEQEEDYVEDDFSDTRSDQLVTLGSGATDEDERAGTRHTTTPVIDEPETQEPVPRDPDDWSLTDSDVGEEEEGDVKDDSSSHTSSDRSSARGSRGTDQDESEEVRNTATPYTIRTLQRAFRCSGCKCSQAIGDSASPERQGTGQTLR
ncbi:unnamed protein product [Zymoseptoria tritici ST99CH_3D7]|uniref:Uncharacterized protein n=1 Tax=Zymoseptoria tritici (strain ST99CH_3D7) TaxID=1276538 RepID=A0A1X7S8F9_ZYMT9|nr:unnamed protein product [Zymoseptoria tritici ST99CH_3D7]